MNRRTRFGSTVFDQSPSFLKCDPTMNPSAAA
jgi:hypothetical protein